MKLKVYSQLALVLSIAFGAMGVSQSQTQAELSNTKDVANVLVPGMNYNNQRYTTLKGINKANVANMAPVWNYSLSNLQTQESQPIVYNGVMYITTHTSTIALNALTGRQIWKTDIEYPADVAKTVCCGLLNRGVSIYNGKVYRGTLDAFLLAYDAKTGKQVWKTKVADYQDGHAITSAPLIANGVVMTGIAGGEYGTRGFVDGYDPETGAKLWRTYTTAAPGEKGGDTWPGDTASKGGAPTWLTGVYDPELDMVYWGTGNAGPWNA